jgi:hypothetical protein
VAPKQYTYSDLANLPETEEAFRNSQKMNSFEFNGVACSIRGKDQNGWTSVEQTLDIADRIGKSFQPFKFPMQNGNTVVFETREEWEEFVIIARTARSEFFTVITTEDE